MTIVIDPLVERDRLLTEGETARSMRAKANVEKRDAADEIKEADIETAAAYQRAARGTEGEQPEDAEQRVEIARQRYDRADRAREAAYRAERIVDAEMRGLLLGNRERFCEEAEQRSALFTKWRTKAAAQIEKLMLEGWKLERDALHLWNPISSALKIDAAVISQVTAIRNRGRQLAVDVPRPAGIIVDGGDEPVTEARDDIGHVSGFVWPNGRVARLKIGSDPWKRAVKEGAEATDPPPGAE